MNKVTQRQKILDWLKSGNGLTTRQAMLELNINSPAKRIEELRKMGYPIELKWIVNEAGTRYGIYQMEV